MKAAVLQDVGVIEVQEVPEPEIAPNQIKVKIAYAGICGTDPEQVEGRFGLGFMPEGAVGRPLEKLEPGKGPTILGHEASGTVVEIGSEVKGDFRVGQKVAMNFKGACGECWYCNNAMEHFCENVTRNSGAMAEYAVYKEGTIFPLPEDMPLDVGAFLEPLSVAVHTMDIARMKVGDTVLIAGGGTIGQLILQLAVRSGASRILVSEPFAEKRKLAREMGADMTVDPLNEDLAAAARKLTDGRGFDVCFEASGRPQVAGQLILMVEGCGTIVWAAVYPTQSEVPVPAFYMYQKELTIRSVKVSPYSFPRALQMLPKLNLKPMITVFPMKDVVKAFEAHHEGRGIKIMLQP